MRRLAHWIIRIGWLPDSTLLRRFMRRTIYEPFGDPRDGVGFYHLGPMATQKQAQDFSEWLDKPRKPLRMPEND